MPKLEAEVKGAATFYWFGCPGCGFAHCFVVRDDNEEPKWDFNGDMEKPSFVPSLNLRELGCHLWMKDGKIEYCMDSRHRFAGEQIDVPEFSKAFYDQPPLRKMRLPSEDVKLDDTVFALLWETQPGGTEEDGGAALPVKGKEGWWSLWGLLNLRRWRLR